MIVRLATSGDVPAVADVFEASGESLTWPGLPGWPYVEHLVARARVPIAIVDGVVVGMAGSLEVGRTDVRFLSDLFVRPDRQDGGVGRALLAAAFAGASQRFTFSSADPRALGLYIRTGLRPWWPVLYLEASPSSLGEPDRAFQVEPAEVATTAGWSRAWTGMDRTVDFRHYASLPDGTGWLAREAGQVAAVAWSNRGRTRPVQVLDHVSVAPGADPVRVVLALMRAAVATSEALILTIPGPHPAVAGLLERGARIVDRDEFCATDPSLLDPARILPNPGFL